MNVKIIFFLLFFTFKCIASENVEDCTDLARDDETLLVFSTLGGGLTAVDLVTSEIRWQINDEPTIKSPSTNDFPMPQYLPDPRDGSLYQLGGLGGLKKLPYTIPELVASAPCRSSDGILYSGKKSDTWFFIDPKTGKREKVLDFGSTNEKPNSESIGWATSRGVYLGRTQYTVMMYDSLTKDKNSKPWNVTFFDYSSHTMAPELTQEYEWLHLSSSVTGQTVTLNRFKGTFMWQKDLQSPVVAVFLLGPDGLLSVPFTTVSDDALQNIINYAKEGHKTDVKLFQTLYVGEHPHGLYAIPSLVGKDTATITTDSSQRLLDGPDKEKKTKDSPTLININKLYPKEKHSNIILFGHYQIPKENNEFKLDISPSSAAGKIPDNKQLSTAINYEIFNINKNQQDFIISSSTIGTQTGDGQKNITIKKHPKEIISNFYFTSKNWINDQESKILKVFLIILTGSIIAMFWYVRSTIRELKQSQNGSQTIIIPKSKNNSGSSYTELIEMEDGETRVGKICFNSSEVLGKGCEGTFVFKGTFEKRDVAVKRLLPECFTLADREVSLLRESDTHENVIRYFCTEQDRQFKYIALELCSATLQDYTEGRLVDKLKSQITVLDVLKQSTSGLMHLHSLNIVHRDIKPQNVLLSFPDAYGIVRAMISDFGLCKKLNFGKASFSRRSGITGTEGWIAPEMLRGQRTTTSVDIFSLGCVFYYVISNGKHPFGDTLKRQANILSSEFDLNDLKEVNEDVLSKQLIADMICKEANKRPTARAISNHPLFWSEEKILAFLQDVSDRVEKAIITAEPLSSLEKNAKFVVRGDWNNHLDYAVTADMKKYRGYQGYSIRDLLRALRNKKHHYHELDEEIQLKLGSLPIEFTRYWIDRFPYLLSHSYHAMEICWSEKSFKSYYPLKYNFTKPEYFFEETDEELIANYYQNSKQNASPKKNFNEKRDFRSNGNSNNNNIKKKNGSYNFHRIDESGGLNRNNICQVQGEGFTRNINISAATAAVGAVAGGDGFILRKNTRRKANVQEQNVTWTMPNTADHF